MRVVPVVALLVAVGLASSAIGREMILVEPGESIQAAVEHAAPGSTLVLPAGAVYAGSLTIEMDIALVAEQPLGDLPTLMDLVHGVASLLPQSAPQIAGGIVIQSGSVTLQGIHVSCNGDTSGVRVRHGKLMMTGCYISRAAGAGLSVDLGATATAVGVEIFGSSGYGVVVEPGAICTLSYCCVSASHAGGIQCSGLLSASDTTIKGSGQLLPPVSANGLTVEAGGTAWLERSYIGWNTGYGVSEVDSCGGLQGVENVTRPSFGPEPNSLGALTGECGFPDGFLADGYEAPVTFWWHFAGQEFEIDALPLWVPLAEDLQEWPTPRARVDARTDASLRLLAHKLLALAAGSGFVKDAEIVEFVGAFIGQSVAYDHPRSELDEPGYHSPVTTLVRRSGVCRDYALLATMLLDEMGFDTAYVVLPPLSEGVSHAVVGVSISDGCEATQVPVMCGQSVDLDGIRYFLLETINPTPRLGDVPLGQWGEPEVTPASVLSADRSLIQVTAETFVIPPGAAGLASPRALVRLSFRNTGPAPSEELRVRLEMDTPWQWVGVIDPGESRAITVVLNSNALSYGSLVVEWVGEDLEYAGAEVIRLDVSCPWR